MNLYSIDNTPRSIAASSIDRSHDVLTHSSVQSKQRAAIEKIRRDNEVLKDELLLENKLCVRPTRHATTKQIAQLQSEADALTRKIELEKRRVGFLGIKADAVRGKIQTLRIDMGGIDAARDAERTLQKQVKILENRLEKAYRTYSERVAKNRRLREMIDSYRREKLMLDNINTGVEKENEKMKKEMTKIIKNTKTLHEQREGVLGGITLIKARTEKLQRNYEKEWTDLSQIIEENRLIQETKRVQEMEERERKTQELLHSTQASEQNSIAPGVASVDKQLQAQQKAMEKVKKYSASFEEIQKATGIDDMEAIIQHIAKAEDRNYTLFNFINELDGDIERLKIKTASLCRESRDSDKNANVIAEPPIPSDSEPGIGSSAVERESTETENAEMLTILQDTAALLERIPQPYRPEIEAGEEVTVDNVERILGCVETILSAPLDDAHNHSGDVSKKAVSPSLAIHPPSTLLEDMDAIELELFDDEKPVTGSTLRANVAKMMGHKSMPSSIEIRSPNSSAQRREHAY